MEQHNMSHYIFYGNTYNTLEEAQTEMSVKLNELESAPIQQYISIKLVERTDVGIRIFPQELSRIYVEAGNEYLITIVLSGRTHITDDIDLIDILINDAKLTYKENSGYTSIYEVDSETNNTIGIYDENGNYTSLVPDVQDIQDADNIDNIINDIVTSE